MPQRTNVFQELFELIQYAFSQRGDKLTPSAMVKVIGLTKEREVDILRESIDGERRVKVAYEAKDESRRFDVGDLESYIGKYFGKANVEVDQLVIVTRRGYTGTAIEKAKAYEGKIILLTLDQAKAFDWSALPQQAPWAQSLPLHFHMAPRICRLEFKPGIGPEQEREALKVGRIYCPHGHDHGTAFLLARRKIDDGIPGQRPLPEQLADMLKLEPEVIGMLTIGLPGHVLNIVGTKYRIDEMIVHIHAASEVAQLASTPYEMKSVNGESQLVYHLRADFRGRIIEMAVPGGLHPPPNIGMRVRPKKDAQQKKTPRERAKERKAARKRNRKGRE